MPFFFRTSGFCQSCIVTGNGRVAKVNAKHAHEKIGGREGVALVHIIHASELKSDVEIRRNELFLNP